ncbi:MAG TPA: hypothetical protein VFC51_06530 [Chloroflexota bacterium]|nr:hypothetical protein [Chloroflexota bacterium]
MTIVVRVLRRIAARTVRGSARRGRIIALALFVIAGIIALSSFDLWPSLSLSVPSTGSSSAPVAQNEPSSTAAYLRGQQTYDAKLVWQAYSDRVIQDLQQRGVSQDETQRQLDRVREIGSRIDRVQYIGGYPIPSGSMQFYVVARTNPSSSDATYIPYVFTLDTKGKIDRVE